MLEILIFRYLFTQAANYDAAYEAFDSVLELDPTYNNARFNLGSIASYYGGWLKLAQDDLQAFYQSIQMIPFVRFHYIL